MIRSYLTRIMASFPAARVPIPKNGVDYRGKIVLAPMVRSGELPSRLMALKYGADLVWGPETVDRALIGADTRHNPRAGTVEFTRMPSNNNVHRDPQNPPKESIIYRIHPELESSRLIFQIGTASPELAVQASTMVAPYVCGIDVNSGCPKPFSTSGGMGAALLSTPDLLCNILRSLVQEVGQKFDIGISVKIRLLKEEADTRELVHRLCETGITGLTIHCRTRYMRKTEKAIRDQLRMVGEVCRQAGVACLMNGDVEDRAQAEQLAREYGVDGAMIATAAEKNPSVFRPDGVADWKEVVQAYMKAAIDIENRWGNTKFLLAQMIPGKAQGGKQLSSAKNYEHVCQLLGLENLLDQARQLDERLGMTERVTKSEQKAQKAEKKRLEADAANETDVAAPSKRQKQNLSQDPVHDVETENNELGGPLQNTLVSSHAAVSV